MREDISNQLVLVASGITVSAFNWELQLVRRVIVPFN